MKAMKTGQQNTNTATLPFVTFSVLYIVLVLVLAHVAEPLFWQSLDSYSLESTPCLIANVISSSCQYFYRLLFRC